VTDGRRTGWFVASEAAAHLSAAAELQGERVPVVAVFARDRMDVCFTLPNGGQAELTASGYGADGSRRGTSALTLRDAASGEHRIEYRWVPDGDALVLVFETAHEGDVVAGRLDLDAT
jgi:hypothetical protein